MADYVIIDVVKNDLCATCAQRGIISTEVKNGKIVL